MEFDCRTCIHRRGCDFKLHRNDISLQIEAQIEIDPNSSLSVVIECTDYDRDYNA